MRPLYPLIAAKIVLITAATVLFASCASSTEPKYRIETFYDAPMTASGQQCLNQCDANQMMCEARALDDADRCEAGRRQQDSDCIREATDKRNYCLRNNAPSCDLVYSNTLSFCRSSIRQCSVDYSSCNAMQDACFQRCGGTIRRERICVKNCEFAQ